jgi:hypothetical protein
VVSQCCGLERFISQSLPAARENFDASQDLIGANALEDTFYEEFTARVRRRDDGVDEDDQPDLPFFDDDPC